MLVLTYGRTASNKPGYLVTGKVSVFLIIACIICLCLPSLAKAVSLCLIRAKDSA
nr:hypothetical protein [Clostridioides difficile]